MIKKFIAFIILNLLNFFFCTPTGYVTSITVHSTKIGSNKISSLCKSDKVKVRDAFYPLSDSSVNRMTSDHFQIIYGSSDSSGSINDEFIKGNLINLENIRAFYINQLGMKDVTTSSLLSGKYKLNVYVTFTGLTGFEEDWAYMSMDEEQFTFLVLDLEL